MLRSTIAIAYLSLVSSVVADTVEFAASSCKSWSSPVDQANWWISEYGASSYATIVVDGTTPDHVKLAQLLLVGKELHVSGKLDRIRYLSLQVATIDAIQQVYGASEILAAVTADFRNELEISDRNFDKNLICAFECIGDSAAEAKALFSNCIEGD